MSISAIDWAGRKRVATTRSHASQLASLLTVAAFYWISRVFREEAPSVELDIPFTSSVRLRQLYQRRTVAPHEVVQALLAQIDAVNPKINAVVTLARESALQEARRATAALRRGRSLPPLFGVPVGIKDVTPTKGIRTPMAPNSLRATCQMRTPWSSSVCERLPCGFTRGGLPVGLQIVGKPRGEAAVLRGAAAFEAAHPWAHRIPPSVERV
jgi:Asp-tRNA(Asn)/Glu-tRNA(Gln) amidotransferase A subunit family amidase